ncbi:hypothetical protein HW115_18055 [Verrucomicrobiaceae bacterium N1E253]|uniref:Uncharacterized protein n=1 Tax=Oceaniferula marina TaxID=2748318 RepID=A0A851GRA3_9BACT|nr:hypothetical protein [Oceaniferula marina]NWK57527.1 hypothetical protein [Oceaniferula marina]
MSNSQPTGTEPQALDDQDQQPENDPTKGKFSPFAGCSIFIIAGTIALGMVTFLIWSYFQTRDMVESFTDEKPKSIEMVDTSGRESEQVELKSKLVGFRHNVEARHQAEMRLTAEEMNLAIATFEILKPHQGKLYIREITESGIIADISFPTKSRMRSDENRYINATLTIQPELVDGAPFPKITAIQSDNAGEVHEQFKQFISETLLKPVYDDPEIGPVFQGLSGVEINEACVLLKTDPGYQAPASQPEESTELIIDRLLKGFAIIAVVFLAITTTIIILARRKTKR